MCTVALQSPKLIGTSTTFTDFKKQSRTMWTTLFLQQTCGECQLKGQRLAAAASGYDCPRHTVLPHYHCMQLQGDCMIPN